MTRAEWIAQATRDADKLRALLASYHPVQRDPRTRPGDHITAAAPESACVRVREALQYELMAPGVVFDPVAHFTALLKAGDIDGLMTVLNQAWFGVPESTDCWQVEGFAEAVALIEDPPEEDGGPS